ncbi:rhodanese-related sulfurtransferase [Novosphingobium chloroacetimidivorans]|uniref:Rhodanese-related sulfurtransferase n=1 Tax=Novosphingobium chloroacetimidivorans TaxID=1428314 RepID=A0A7W7KB46_9SPHN|nr:rhodanese-like domain-containing protein [Novosphingobium chloroacetimidivorans]MBB4858928.1 rhodanese-related sulfurtransferase [Novosphingobium chloroacetimidivorans]
MPDYHDLHELADRARRRIREISPGEARAKLAEGALLIDVRDEDELLRNPPLGGALHLSRGRLEYLITDAVDSKDDPLVIYCAGGNRGALATWSLQSLGYTRVFNVRGGLHAWREDIGEPWFPPGWERGGSFDAGAHPT